MSSTAEQDARVTMQEQLRRKASQKIAIESLNNEQARLTQQDARTTMQEQLRRKASQKIAVDSLEGEQARCQTVDLRATMQEQLVVQSNQKSVDKQMVEEQARRIAEGGVAEVKEKCRRQSTVILHEIANTAMDNLDKVYVLSDE